ncbi:T2EA [Enterospora canceri]|uniref:T2EA n=1 Tax=Enterospora canceri TaxID=1081671 RepID=A0A1Y1S653_9MICR|nr:T2EA [Enterospora canceri]
MAVEYEKKMHQLITYVIKVFYSPQHSVFMSFLLEKTILTEEECCRLMKLLNREFNKIVMRLREDKLIRVEQKLHTTSVGKDELKTVYYINYAEVRDVIKYKIMKMNNLVEKSNRVKEDMLKCIICDKTYSMLDAQAFVEDFVFKCPICKNELLECTVQNERNGIDNRTFINKLEYLIRLLKAVDQYKIPNMDYFQMKNLKAQKSKTTEETAVQEAEEKEIEEVEPVQNDSEEFDVKENKVPSPIEKKTSEIVYVTVNGIEKDIDKITEEDKEKMTEDEYVAYYEKCGM